MAKRKVLIVVHRLNFGGSQAALLQALDAIDYEKNDVTLFVRKNRVDLLKNVNKNVSKIIVNEDDTHYYRKPYSAWLSLQIKIKKKSGRDTKKHEKKLTDYILKKQFEYECRHYFSNHEKYDIAISYIQGFTAAFVAWCIEAERKIMFWHTSTDDHHELHEEIMPSFERIYCVSRGASAVISDCYPQFADKLDVLENYVDYKRVIARSTAYSPALPQGKLIFCSCGRMTDVKGFDLAVKAAKKLRDDGVDFVWFFVGDGVERKKIEEMIDEQELGDSIVITGLLDNPFPYVKACDIYVQPSYEEAYPLSLVEAQILCRPIVTTATVGGKTVVKDSETGVIADIDANSLAAKVSELAYDKQKREKLSANLRGIDYESDRIRFRRQWAELLEDEALD